MNKTDRISEYCREHPEWRFAKASYNMARDAYYGIGFFEDEYVIDAERESELDNICAFEEYEMSAVSLLDFRDVMRQYGIVRLLGKGEYIIVMKMIKGIELYAESFPDKITVLLGNVHRILDMIAPDRATAVKASESNEPVRDYMHIQLLFLLGTRMLFEKSLETSTYGKSSIRGIICMLDDMLRKKMLQFTITSWTDEGEKQLAPLCRYMMSTDVGRELQYDIFSGKGLPAELESVEARIILMRAVGEGYLDENFKQNASGGMTNAQMRLFATLAGIELGLKNPLKPFGQLWKNEHFKKTSLESASESALENIKHMFNESIINRYNVLSNARDAAQQVKEGTIKYKKSR